MLFEAVKVYYFLYALFSIPICLCAFLFFRLWKRYDRWYLTDLFGIFLPGFAYLGILETSLYRYFGLSKTLANLIEPMILGAVCGILFIIRCFLGYRSVQRSRRISLLIAISSLLVGALLPFLVPALIE